MFVLVRHLVLGLLFFTACSSATGTGMGAGPGGGAGGGAAGGGTGGGSGGGTPTSGAFLVTRDSESAGVQLASDASGTVRFVAAPGRLGSDGHANVVYGECKSNCGAPASWSYLYVGDGFFSGDCAIAVEPNGTVHIALLDRLKSVTFGKCAQNCTSATGGWTFEKVTSPATQNWASLPKGRALAVLPGGLERFYVNDSNGGGNVVVVARTATGFVANPVATGQVSALQVIPKGDGLQLLARVDDNTFPVAYAECGQGCEDATDYSLGTFTHANSTFIAGTRTSDGVLHAVFSSSLNQMPAGTDVLLWSRCSSNCTQESSWTQAAIGDGNAARGSLDLAARSDGTLGLVTAAPAATFHTVEVRTCPAGCTSASAWTTPVQADRSGDVKDAHPVVSQACATPAYVWSVGTDAQLAPSGSGFLLGYNATSLTRCPSAPADQYVSIGSFVRLKAQ